MAPFSVILFIIDVRKAGAESSLATRSENQKIPQTPDTTTVSAHAANPTEASIDSPGMTDIAMEHARRAGCSADATAPGFIGVFDSGAGGISVARALVSELPHERFVYFGDSANAPYGDKTEEQVRELSFRIAEDFIIEGAKAIVIACNTATSAAADILRSTFANIPIVGIEPALKPAALDPNCERILVMATRTTLDLDKFHALARAYGSDSIVFTQACPGLADAIEKGDLEGPAMHALLKSLIGKYADERIDSVVLGCTHYPFVKNQIAQILGNVRFFDGNAGTARQLRRVLDAAGLLAPQMQPGSLVLRTSSAYEQAQLDLYARFFELPIEPHYPPMQRSELRQQHR